MTTKHPGFPPKYWEMLVRAALEMDKAEACSDCMLKWRNHGPAHYRAFRNVENCPECAIRTVIPVERAVLDWQYEHDPLKTSVKNLIDAYRSHDEARKSIRDLMGNWQKYLDDHEKKGTRAPDEIRDERYGEDAAALKAFWQAVANLDNIVSKANKEE